MLAQGRCWVALWWVAVVVTAAAADDGIPSHDGKPSPDEHSRSLPVVKVQQPPKLDGVLDDPCWKHAAHVSGFYYPTENRSETEPTESWVCVDADNLYAAIYAHDRHPDEIIALQTVRSGSLWRDDHVAVLVDCTGRGTEHYEFQVSPLGTQTDVVPNLGSENYAWRGTWRAATRRVADGYIVEIAIPFHDFRYSADQRIFGIGFARNLPRARARSFWPKMADRYIDRKLARLAPLSLKPQAQRPLILPYAIARVDNGGPTVQTGLDVKHLFPNGISAVGTLNPDFKNVAEAVDSIAFTYVPRMLSEMRPFLREGSGYFPEATAWYSLTVPSIIAGAKSFGREGNTEFGALSALSDHHQIDSVLNYRYRLTPDSYAGTGLVYHNDATDHVNVVSANRFRWFQELGTASFTSTANYYRSVSHLSGGNGDAWNVSTSYGGNGHIGGSAGYSLVDPTFLSVDGYVPDPDIRGWYAGLSGNLRTQRHWLQYHSWSFYRSEYHKQDGSMLAANWSGDFYGRFASGTSIYTRLAAGQRGTAYHDRTAQVKLGWGINSLADEGSLECTFGREGGGDYLHLQLVQGWQPIDPLRFNLSSEFTYQYYTGITSPTVRETQNIFTAVYQLTPWSTISSRFIEHAGAVNLFLAYRISRLDGRSLYVFFGDPNAARTVARVQVKVVWPL
jgi:hypothetical protein